MLYLFSYQRAGQLYKILSLFGWLGGLFFGMILVNGLLSRQPDLRSLLVVVALAGASLGSGIFCWILGTAIERHVAMARVVGILAALVQLVMFPVGTLTGSFLLWCLIQGWEASSEEKVLASSILKEPGFRSGIKPYLLLSFLTGSLAPVTGGVLALLTLDSGPAMFLGLLGLAVASVFGLIGPVVLSMLSHRPLVALGVIPNIVFWSWMVFHLGLPCIR